MSKKHMGSSIDDFLKKQGIFEEAQAIKEVVAWQLAEAMKKQKISKSKLATLLKTSRTQVGGQAGFNRADLAGLNRNHRLPLLD